MADKSEAKHTPGPWIVMDNDAYDHVFTEAKPHRRICGVYGGIRGENDIDVTNRHNAKLIAAAPEMLAILIEQQESGLCWDEWGIPLTMGERINDVIRKATT